jgi:hypothetical protein
MAAGAEDAPGLPTSAAAARILCADLGTGPLRRRPQRGSGGSSISSSSSTTTNNNNNNRAARRGPRLKAGGETAAPSFNNPFVHRGGAQTGRTLNE